MIQNKTDEGLAMIKKSSFSSQDKSFDRFYKFS